jgi:hypothetical protein
MTTRLFLVQRVAVTTFWWMDNPLLWPNKPREPISGVPLLAFPDARSAVVRCAELERQARETTPVGPFLSPLLPAGISLASIEAAARAIGLPPPDLSSAGPCVGIEHPHPGQAVYTSEYFHYRKRVESAVRAWWAAHAADVSASANAKLWDLLFPEHRFYDVALLDLAD